MANQANRESLQSRGGGDVYSPPADLSKLIIAEEDPKHANHAEHMLRVAPDDPENVALLASFRAHGWIDGLTISVWKDGKIPNERWVVSNGRRRLTSLRAENERRAREKDERGPIRPLVVTDSNPLLTETAANAMHKGDPPMVRGRRFLQLRQGGMPAAAAAAALGLSLADANALVVVIGLPNPELHEAVNSKAIPVDVAARAAKAGSATTRKVLDDVKAAKAKAPAVESKGGRPSKKTPAERAARDATPKRARSQNSERIKLVSDFLRDHDGMVKVCSALDWAAGGASSDPPKWLSDAIEAATKGDE